MTNGKVSKRKELAEQLERQLTGAKQAVKALEDDKHRVLAGCTHLWDNNTSAVVSHDFYDACEICGGPG